MKFSKAQIQEKFHKIPMMRFEDQKLTSFSGQLIFQLLFKRLNLSEFSKSSSWKNYLKGKKPDEFAAQYQYVDHKLSSLHNLLAEYFAAVLFFVMQVA